MSWEHRCCGLRVLLCPHSPSWLAESVTVWGKESIETLSDFMLLEGAANRMQSGAEGLG